jgi:hypothetical protein
MGHAAEGVPSLLPVRLTQKWPGTNVLGHFFFDIYRRKSLEMRGFRGLFRPRVARTFSAIR